MIFLKNVMSVKKLSGGVLHCLPIEKSVGRNSCEFIEGRRAFNNSVGLMDICEFMYIRKWGNI